MGQWDMGQVGKKSGNSITRVVPKVSGHVGHLGHSGQLGHVGQPGHEDSGVNTDLSMIYLPADILGGRNL